MKTMITHGGKETFVEPKPIKKDGDKSFKVNNSELAKAKKLLALLTSHC